MNSVQIKGKLFSNDLCRYLRDRKFEAKSKIELSDEQQVVNAVGDGGEEEGVLALHNPPRPHDQARTKFSTPSEKKDNQP